MDRKYQRAFERANEAIRQNRAKRGLAADRQQPKTKEAAIETLNCANAFARSGKNVEHIFDKLF